MHGLSLFSIPDGARAGFLDIGRALGSINRRKPI